jgi:hypothetical protein
VVPRCEYGDQISREAKCLCSGRHVADEVGAKAGILIRLKIRKMDHGARSDGRRGEVRHESYNEFLLPEEVERDDCGDAVCRELRWVDLVKQDFFLKCHASIVAWGRMVGSWCEVAYSISTDASRLKAARFIFGVSDLVAAARRTDGGRTHRSQRQRCLVSCRGSAGAPGMSRTRPSSSARRPLQTAAAATSRRWIGDAGGNNGLSVTHTNALQTHTRRRARRA